MAHLLMVDSWVTEMGQFLPQAIERLGHSFTFVTRDLTHYLKKPPPHGWHPLLNARNVLTTETNDTASLLAFAERYRQLVPFDGVITSCDYYLSGVAQLAERFGLPTTPPDAFETARLKHRMRAALDRAGLPNARYRVTTTWEETKAAAEEIGYPVVLKPTDLCSSMFVVVAQDEAALRGAFDQLDDFPINTRKITREPIFLIEEYLRGEEISVEALTYQGDTTIIGITDKSLSDPPAFIETGHMTPAVVSAVDAEATIDLTRQALQAVGYTHGLSHTEVKLTPDGPRIVEINVRCGGGHISQLYRLTQGVDPVEMMVQLALGQRPTYEPRATGIQSAAVMYYVAPRGGTVAEVRGLDTLDSDPSVVEWHLPDLAGTTLRAPIDNNDCLGHVLCVDRDGLGARAKAEAALARIDLTYADERVAALPGPPDIQEGMTMTISTPASRYTRPRPHAVLPPAPNTTDELLQQARNGLYGPPPSTMIVTYAFTTCSKSRHVGWANTYANYAVSLRVGRSVGSCLFEPGTVTQDEVEACCTLTLDELLDHPNRPIKIAALDAYFAELFPHHESPIARPYQLPEGSTTDKLGARAAGVMSLLDPRPGQYVAMIGVIGTMIAWLREHDVRYKLCDRDPQPPLSGDTVYRDMEDVIQGADGILSTGMTISNAGFDRLLEHCRTTGTPLVVYSQSGSHCIPRFLGNGVTGISAEPYPFFWAHGAPSTVFHYHARDLSSDAAGRAD